MGLQNLTMYSENLKQIRLKLKYSRQNLSEILDVSAGSIVQYESGTRKPNFEFLEKLISILNINLNWFVTGKGEMFNNTNEALKNELRSEFEELLRRRGL